MRMNIRLLGLLTSLVLTACGGGGGGDSSAPAGTAEGAWAGTASDGSTVSGVVLRDGSSWFIYSDTVNPNIILGVVQGASTSIDGNYESANAKNFDLSDVDPVVSNGTISGNYAQKQTLDGTASSGSGSVVFNLTYDARYDLTPSLASIDGTYAGEDFVTRDPTTVTIASNGSLTSVSESGCQATGTVTPNPFGNVYDVVVTFLGGSCSNGTSVVTGILVGDGVTLIGAALNPARTNGFLYFGDILN